MLAICESGRGEDYFFCRRLFVLRSYRIGAGLLALLMEAVVPGHRSVGGLGLHRLAVGADEHARHHAEGSVSLGHGVRLHVSVVVLAGPDKAALALHGLSHHVVDQAVLVPDKKTKISLKRTFDGAKEGRKERN